MLNTTQQSQSQWDAIVWWLINLFERPAQPQHYTIVAQPVVKYVDIGRKFPIPADKLDYYYTAAD